MSQGGILCAAVATLGVVLPSFVIILLIARLFAKGIKHPTVQAILKGVKPCIMGVILATGFSMALGILTGLPCRLAFDLPSTLLFVLLVSFSILYPKISKKPLSPIILIVLSAILGIFLY